MTELKGYHAHVYYDRQSRDVAERLRQTLISRFPVKPGGFSDDPIGPHPVSQFNVMFETDAFQEVVPFLMFHRDNLAVLVHPLTDDMYADHSDHALWLGPPVDLKLDGMRQRQYRDALLPTAAS